MNPYDRLAHYSKQLFRTVNSMRSTSVYLESDSSDWILDWIGRYVSTYLEQAGISTQLNTGTAGLRNQIIHYLNRHAYLKGAFREIHQSNHVFFSWFHGDPADPNPARQYLFSVLPEAAAHTEKIVVSCSISYQILRDQGIPETKLVTIPLGVDLSRFQAPTASSKQAIRAKLGIPPQAICIGSFQKDGQGWQDGRKPKLIKGPDIFLKVIANLSRHTGNLFVLLTGPARGYVKEGLDKLGVPYLHHYLNDYHDIVNYYHALDLYLITSRVEGGPAALLESWATGVPLVSSRVGMPADLIQSGKNGMLADVEDVENLTQYALMLLQDKELRQACRNQALEDVRLYGWSAIAARYYQALYRPFLP